MFQIQASQGCSGTSPTVAGVTFAKYCFSLMNCSKRFPKVLPMLSSKQVRRFEGTAGNFFGINRAAIFLRPRQVRYQAALRPDCGRINLNYSRPSLPLLAGVNTSSLHIFEQGIAFSLLQMPRAPVTDRDKTRSARAPSFAKQPTPNVLRGG